MNLDRSADQKPGKPKPWATPSVRRIDLTTEERGQLKGSDDPMALLQKMRPELKPGK